VVSGSDHYFTGEPNSAPVERSVRMRLGEEFVALTTSSGTFSPTRIDAGTALLIESLPGVCEAPAGAVLDLGCGYGPLALTVAQRWPDRPVWAIDVNQRALADCRSNAQRLGLPVEVVDPEAVPADQGFAVIVSNPPVRIGKAAQHSLLSTWVDRLVPGGEAWLVVSRHLGADTMASWFVDGGRHVERVRSRRGYRILRIT